MIRIEIDLNSRGPRGRTPVALRHVPGSVSVGERVVIFEPDENVETSAVVAELSKDGRFAFLDVDWDLLHEATGILEVVASAYSVPIVIPALEPNVWRSPSPELQLQIAYGA